LINKAFVLEKNLDTPVWRLIRFGQKVLTALPPLELFSLEEKAACVAGWPFRLRAPDCFLSRPRRTPPRIFTHSPYWSSLVFKLKGLQRDHVAGSCKKNTLLKKRAACDGRTVLW